jgi:hypothetical protein
MLRAAFWPRQNLSYQTVRVLSFPCLTLAGRHRLLHTNVPPKHRVQDLRRALPPRLESDSPGDKEHVLVQDTKESDPEPARELETTAVSFDDGSHSSSTPAQASTDLETYSTRPTQSGASSSPSEVPPQLSMDTLDFSKNLDLMLTTHDVVDAWRAYQALSPYLSDASHFAGDKRVLHMSIRRLVKLLAAVDPRTPTVQLRIILVVCTLQNVGAQIRGWEKQLLKVCAEANNIRHSEIRGVMTVVGDILLSKRPKPTFGDSVDGHHDPPQDDVLALLDEPQRQPLLSAELLKSPILVPPVGRLLTENSEWARLLNVLGTTQSFSDAWDAYRKVSALISPSRAYESSNTIPQTYLHRLVSLLATIKPRTREIYLRLVSILSTMRTLGYRIQLWEWNLLIDSSAKGWRKIRPEDYKAALRVFSDMLKYQAEILKSNELTPLDQATESDMESLMSGKGSVPAEVSAPDIYTYTTLVAHAARTLYPPSLDHAKFLLRSSNLAPNRITLLAQMRFYTMRNQMFGVRYLIAEMRERGFDLRNDGINSCLWAFGRNQHMGVAEAIYRLLRHNVVPEPPDPSDDGIEATAKFLDETENIVVLPTMVPDRITYTILIQCYAFQGNLTRTLQIFMDMLSSPDPVAIWRGEDGADAKFVPLLPIYRAIFLGFYRHGVDPRRPVPNKQPGGGRFSTNMTSWNLDNLYGIYKSFLRLPSDQKPGDRVIYWLIMAFAKSSGYDSGRLRKVWKRLEKRFGNNWGRRLQKLRKSIYGNTEHTKADYMVEETDDDDDHDNDE